MIVQPQLPTDTAEAGTGSTSEEAAVAGEFAALLAILAGSTDEEAMALTTAPPGEEVGDEVAQEGEGDESAATLVGSLVASLLAPGGDGTVRPTAAEAAADTPVDALLEGADGAKTATGRTGAAETPPELVSAGPLQRGEIDAEAVLDGEVVGADQADLGAAGPDADVDDARALFDKPIGDLPDIDAGAQQSSDTEADVELPVVHTDTSGEGHGDGDGAQDQGNAPDPEVAVPVAATDADAETEDEANAADTLVSEAENVLADGGPRPSGPSRGADANAPQISSAGPAERGVPTVPTAVTGAPVQAPAATTGTMATTVVEAPQPLSQVPTTTLANVQQALRSGESQHRTVIRLDPPELGTITLEVKAVGDEITVIARADNVEAGRALARQRADMATAVEALGMSLSEFDVQTGSGSESPDRERNSRREQREEATTENPFEQPEPPEQDGDIFL